MAFPLLGLIFAGGVGFKLHRRNAQANKFAEHFKQLGYNDAQAKHLGFVSTDQGVSAAMSMHKNRVEHQMATNPEFAQSRINADISNPLYMQTMPDGSIMRQHRAGTNEWVEFRDELDDAIEINDRLDSYFNKIKEVGLLQGTSTADGAALEAEGISIASDLARSKYGAAMSDDEFLRVERMLSPDLVEAAIRGETTQMTLARIDQTMDDLERRTGRMLKRGMHMNGLEGRRDEFESILNKYDANTRDRDIALAADQELSPAMRAQRNLTAMAQMQGPIADVVQLAAIGTPVLQNLLGGGQGGGGYGIDNLLSFLGGGGDDQAGAAPVQAGPSLLERADQQLNQRGITGSLVDLITAPPVPIRPELLNRDAGIQYRDWLIKNRGMTRQEAEAEARRRGYQ